MPRDRPLEVVVLVAADEADVFQMREVLLGGGGVAEHQVGFAEMLVRAAMARIEHQRLLVMSDRRPHLAQPPPARPASARSAASTDRSRTRPRPRPARRALPRWRSSGSC